MWTYNTIIVLLGTGIFGGAAGVVGTLAILRRRALVGDVFAHATFPGLYIAFLIVGAKSFPALLLGAFISGFIGLAVVSLLRRNSRIRDDAALGIVLGTFFGGGVTLARMVQNNIEASKAGLDSYILGKTAGMIVADVYMIAGVALVCLIVIAFLFKEFRLVIFDAGFANSQGWPVYRLDLLMLLLIGVIVTIGLPAVGVILVAALLILPGATARLWTDRLELLLLLAAGIGSITGVVGTLISASSKDLPAGAVIILTGTSLFLFSLFFAPKRGLLATWRLSRLPLEEPA